MSPKTCHTRTPDFQFSLMDSNFILTIAHISIKTWRRSLVSSPGFCLRMTIMEEKVRMRGASRRSQ